MSKRDRLIQHLIDNGLYSNIHSPLRENMVEEWADSIMSWAESENQREQAMKRHPSYTK